MNDASKPAVIALALCAAADLLAAPALIAGGGDDGARTVVGIATAVLGILTVAAAVGLARGASWAKPLAVATRALDVLSALPGLGAGAAEAVAIGVVTVLSIAAIVLVLRVDHRPAVAAARPY